MSRIELPSELEGEWHHLLILTYSVDIPFFESALWRNLDNRCRNKIILADGRRYLEACDNYARNGLPRHLNQQYVAEGVFSHQAAHAKVILLAQPDRGRLLIGSGNLGMQGYASGGEIFTKYEYSPDAPQALNAFLAVRELVEHLIARGYVSMPAQRRFQHLLEKTTWLLGRPRSEWRPVRYNLKASFLDQLQEAVGQRNVEELWVLSPFYDPQALALRRLLAVFNPGETTLLVQPGHTSVDNAVLQEVLDQGNLRVRVQPFRTGTDRQYVHAKLYLLKLEDRAICLQGSPNLSQAAMLLTDPWGNIEVANLLEGPRDAFDDLLGDLELGLPTVDVGGLDLTLDQSTPETPDSSTTWQLTSGDWHGDWIRLVFRGVLPVQVSMILVIGGQDFAADVLARAGSSLEIRLPPEAIALLMRPIPVALRFGSGAEAMVSNSIFPCNQSALDAAIQIVADTGTLDRVGGLDLDDDEFEQLLGELDSALMIDRRSVWQLAGRTPPSSADEDDEALRLDYIDVDYELLRRHPKIQQYLHRGEGDSQYTRSRLQIILNAITDHFQGLLAGSPIAAGKRSDPTALDGSEAETEQEREEEAQETQHQRRTSAQRVRSLLKRFIRRYLRGFESRDFQQLAGHDVMAQNYIIFSHILWRLYSKDWVEHEFVVESLLHIWRLFWGAAKGQGYYSSLDNEQQEDVRRWAKEYYVDSELLAALFYGDQIVSRANADGLRFELRDFWRHWLEEVPLHPTTETIEVCWRLVAQLSPYNPPRPADIAKRLTNLARLQTKDRFLRGIEDSYGLPQGSCRFSEVTVWPHRTVRCLVLRDDLVQLDQAISTAILRQWMAFEDLDYYRIAQPDCDRAQRMLYFDVVRAVGQYVDKTNFPNGKSVFQIVAYSASYDNGLLELQALATRKDAEAVLPIVEMSSHKTAKSA